MKRSLAFSLVLLCAATAQAQQSYPMLMAVKPLAIAVGTTAEHEVEARYNLYGAFDVWVSGTGVTAEIIPPAKPPAAKAPDAMKKPDAAKPADKPAAPAKPEYIRIKLRFKAAADALPGVRDIRIATAQGASTLGQLVVAVDPVVVESAKNDTRAEAMPVTLPATVCGTIEKDEDVDYFKFTVAAGQSLVFHVRSSRCEDKIHDLQTHSDPIITLKNAQGVDVAMADNYFAADPLLQHTFATAGDYFLEIRDVRYEGNVYWLYAIEVNDRPFVTSVHPMGVKAEKPASVELVGFNLPAGAKATVTLPGNSESGFVWSTAKADKLKLNPVPVVVHDLPEVFEAGGNNTPAAAQKITVPAGISGRVSQPGEIDYYAFDAKKGERFSFEVMARRHQSALEPIIAVLNDKGVRQIENDDLTFGRHLSADSLIDFWAAPADGTYTIELRDLHLEGSPGHVYFLAVERSQPKFDLFADVDKTLLAPGTAGATFVRVTRRNGFIGDVQLGIEGLPPGVKATCGRILANSLDGVIILEAAPGTKPVMSQVKITGKGTFGEGKDARELTAVARPLQETYQPGGGRGAFLVDAHAVSVGEVLDIKQVKFSPSQVTLKPGGTQKIDITIERAEGFDKNVTLDLQCRHLGGIFGNSLPAGVTIDEKNSKTLLTGKVSQGQITLVAAADAKPVKDQVVPVQANVAINFVMKMAYTGQPLYISVAP